MGFALSVKTSRSLLFPLGKRSDKVAITQTEQPKVAIGRNTERAFLKGYIFIFFELCLRGVWVLRAIAKVD